MVFLYNSYTVNRIEKEHAIANMNLIGVTKRDADKRIKVANVPGSDGKQYQVIIRRNGSITAEFALITGNGEERCLGNLNSLCYHSLAVLVQSAHEAEKLVAFCNQKENAELRARIGGEIYEVAPFKREVEFYMVVS